MNFPIKIVMMLFYQSIITNTLFSGTNCLVGNWVLISTKYNVGKDNTSKSTRRPESAVLCYSCPKIEFRTNGEGNNIFADGTQNTFTWKVVKNDILDIKNNKDNDFLIKNGEYKYHFYTNKIIMSGSNGIEYTLTK